MGYPVRRLSAVLQTPGGKAGFRICLREPGRTDHTDHLWPFQGFCVDSIEKKPLNHCLPGTSMLSSGTAGCNLACKYCQNWDISKSREIDTLADQAALEKIARVARNPGCRSTAYTCNDPVIFMEYAIDVAQACRAPGIRAVAVSHGGEYLRRAARGVLPLPGRRQRRRSPLHRSKPPPRCSADLLGCKLCQSITCRHSSAEFAKLG